MTNEQVAPQATPEKQTEDSIPTRRLDPGADVLGAAEGIFYQAHALNDALPSSAPGGHHASMGGVDQP